MIDQTLERWHAVVRGDGDLDALLAEDCVFYSPVVFTPQRGKAITKRYLEAAAMTFQTGGSAGGDQERPFRYVKEVRDGRHAVLEFEAQLGDIVVNGVDILTVDDDGKIVEFKVMLRPLKAVNLMHQLMMAQLAGDDAD